MRYVSHMLQKQKWVQVGPQKKNVLLAQILYLHKYKENTSIPSGTNINYINNIRYISSNTLKVITPLHISHNNL